MNPVLINNATWFTIDIPHIDLSDLHITVFTPNNEPLNPSTILTYDGLRADWTPLEIGTYTVHILLNGHAIPKSPFRVKCFDPQKVFVIPPKANNIIHKPIRFLGES